MSKLILYGQPDSEGMFDLREFLRRGIVDYEWVELDETNKKILEKFGQTDLPHNFIGIQFPDGELVANPTLEEVGKHLGWINKPKYEEYDLSIYGAGPAGLSAAVYAASEGLRTILIERESIGGQAGSSSNIENYMGFPEGICGADLAEKARRQALKFGVEILLLQEGVKGSFINHRIHVNMADGSELIAKSNICATGIEYAKLGLPNEEKFLHKGVYYGAGATEACFCHGKEIFVVGGGNSAGQAATYFSKFADKVYMVIRKGNLAETLSDYLVKRVTTIPNIEILFNSEVKELDGDEILCRIKILNNKEGTETWYDTSKIFICIGGKPNTDWAINTPIIRDINGYLITGSDLYCRDGFKQNWKEERDPYFLETSVPGSFAAGDVRYNSVKRVAAAVGEGAIAVTMVHKYLASL